MLHLPLSWPHWAVWAVFAILLAGLDLVMSFAGAMAVKVRGTEAAPVWFATGAAAALVLFWVISSSLAYGDMVEMNVLWIAVLLTLVPFVNALHTGEMPSRRVIIGLVGMIACVAVIQWPESSPRTTEPAFHGAAAGSVSATALVLPQARLSTEIVDTEEIIDSRNLVDSKDAAR